MSYVAWLRSFRGVVQQEVHLPEIADHCRAQRRSIRHCACRQLRYEYCGISQWHGKSRFASIRDIQETVWVTRLSEEAEQTSLRPFALFPDSLNIANNPVDVGSLDGEPHTAIDPRPPPAEKLFLSW